MDTACVDLKSFDGHMTTSDTIAVENEITNNMYQRSELDYPLYPYRKYTPCFGILINATARFGRGNFFPVAIRINRNATAKEA